MPAIGSDNDTYMLCDSIRRSIDIFNVDIDQSKSRNIAIGDTATLANISLSPPDQLAKLDHNFHARDTSVRGIW